MLVDQLATLTGQTLEPKPTVVREHKRAAPRKKAATVTTKARAKKPAATGRRKSPISTRFEA
jgi:hypothetical protein